MQTYLIINPNGTVKGEQTLTDAMADRLASRGYEIIPQESAPTVKITFGRSRRLQHA